MSEKTPEQNQVDAMESTICTSVLNMVSMKAEKEIKHVLIKADLITLERECMLDGIETDVAEFATIEQFDKSLKPCIDSEAAERKIKPEGFELEIGNKKFRLEVFGVYTDAPRMGEPTSFIIEPVQIMHYAS